MGNAGHRWRLGWAPGSKVWFLSSSANSTIAMGPNEVTERANVPGGEMGQADLGQDNFQGPENEQKPSGGLRAGQ